MKSCSIGFSLIKTSDTVDELATPICLLGSMSISAQNFATQMPEIEQSVGKG